MLCRMQLHLYNMRFYQGCTRYSLIVLLYLFPSIYAKAGILQNPRQSLAHTDSVPLLHNGREYLPWTVWSHCDLEQCEKKRFRVCRQPRNGQQCQHGPLLIQTKACKPKRCRIRKQPVLKNHHVRYHAFDDLFGGHSLLEEFFFTRWSSWTGCYLKDCKQYRWRFCDDSVICGDRVHLQQKDCDGDSADLCMNYRFPFLAPTTTAAPVINEETADTNHDISSDENNEIFDSDFVTTTETILPVTYSDMFRSEDNHSCGVAPLSHRRVMTKIFGGSASSHGKWPWQVALLDQNLRHYCAGTLISNWVITAAHCVRRTMYVLIGEHEVYRDEDSEQLYKPSRIVIHRYFNSRTVENDIAMLKIDQIVWNDYAQPVCLPDADDDTKLLRETTNCMVAGWGKRKSYARIGAGILHEAPVEVVEQQRCREAYAGEHPISSRMLCAGSGPLAKGDTCEGDSGGPLMCQVMEDGVRGPWRIFGITSFGDSCGKEGKYGVYTRISSYLSWINHVMGMR